MYRSPGRPGNHRKPQVSRYKQQAREILRSEEGHALSVRRVVEPESVFGQIKINRGFRRFLLRGLYKVSLEIGWLSLAHNLLKKAALKQKPQRCGNNILSTAMALFDTLTIHESRTSSNDIYFWDGPFGTYVMSTQTTASSRLIQIIVIFDNIRYRLLLILG